MINLKKGDKIVCIRGSSHFKEGVEYVINSTIKGLVQGIEQTLFTCSNGDYDYIGCVLGCSLIISFSDKEYSLFRLKDA